MVNLMEWQKQQQQQQQTGNVNGNGGMMYVKVMTDDQLETLRQQIAVYTTICEQLVEMHKTLTAQQDLAGFSFFGPFLLFSQFFVLSLFLGFLIIW